MAGLTLESALLTAIMLVLIGLLSVSFARRPANAIPLLLPVELAVHRGNGAAARLFVGCRPTHRRRPAPITRPGHGLTTEQPGMLGHMLIERPLHLDGVLLLQLHRRAVRRPAEASSDRASPCERSEGP